MAENETFINKVRNALDNFLTLDILTVVGRVTHQAGQTSPDIDYTQDPKTILTRVNLLQGDSTTVFPPECLTDEYQTLRDFHAAQVKEGHAIIEANLATLEKLLAFVKTHLEPGG